MKIVQAFEFTAETQPQLQPALLRLSAMISQYFTIGMLLPSIRRALWWTSPGGPFGVAPAGMRKLEPPAAIFVKREGGVHLSFDVVVSLFIP